MQTGLKVLTKYTAGGLLGSLLSTAALAGDLVINYDGSDPAPKEAFEMVISKFEAAHPDIKVKWNIFDHEGYKTSIRNFLTADAPDVAAWYAGNRMAPFVNAGLFEDVTDVWDNNNLNDELASTAPSMTIDGKKWGVPYTYYQWGIYYRKDLFEKAGIAPPTAPSASDAIKSMDLDNMSPMQALQALYDLKAQSAATPVYSWEEFLAACATLKEAGITPITIGSKYLWTTAGVFDYLNLRTNGYAVHNDLTAGKIKYTDSRIQKTFDHWEELVRPGYFIENHAAYSWQEGLAPMVQGEAAMYVMGNFAVAPLREAGLTDDQLEFMQFPVITEGLPMAEEAPTDTFHIPANAKNKEDARKFLAFLASADVQTEVNKILGQLPANKNSQVADDKFIQAGFNMLSSAAGLAQFYDRDAPAEMAKAGMEGFQEFMLKPDRRQKILERLDKVQEKVYK